MANLPDLDLAWAAGMFEGEGSVRVKKPIKRGPCAVLRCELSNTDEQIVRFFHENWGGTIVSVSNRGPNCKPQSRWVASSNDSYRFLRDIYRFLKTDRVREKANVGLAAHISGDPWPYYEKMKRLNAKGESNEFTG